MEQARWVWSSIAYHDVHQTALSSIVRGPTQYQSLAAIEIFARVWHELMMNSHEGPVARYGTS